MVDIHTVKRGRTKKFDKVHERIRGRWAEIGRAFEGTVSTVLEKMVSDKKIFGFTQHPPHSVEDRDGMDFTVEAVVGGVTVKKSFGVTVSLRRWNHSKMIHSDIPQWCFPGGNFNQDHLVRKILDLFKVEEKPVRVV